MILRRINPHARKEAEQLHVEETCSWLRCLSLNSSTRAATLLAQRRTAAGGGSGAGRAAAAARQLRVPAAERREIWRIMQASLCALCLHLNLDLAPVTTMRSATVCSYWLRPLPLPHRRRRK
jgi:hypothetical protein